MPSPLQRGERKVGLTSCDSDLIPDEGVLRACACCVVVLGNEMLRGADDVEVGRRFFSHQKSKFIDAAVIAVNHLAQHKRSIPLVRTTMQQFATSSNSLNCW